MLRMKGFCNTLTAGDIITAARYVGGHAEVSACDKDENCHWVAVIPKKELERFCDIVEDRQWFYGS